MTDTALNCDVCGTHEAKGVASVPGVPISVAYCQECLNANAHPWGILVVNTSLIGHLSQSAEWWQEMVRDTCAHLGRSIEEFNLAVEVEVREFDKEYERYVEQEESTTEQQASAGNPLTESLDSL
jgi:hypothetical protein